jgi:hypothetical protein
MIAIRRHNTSSIPPRFEWLTARPRYTYDPETGELVGIEASWSELASEAFDVTGRRRADDWAEDVGGVLTRVNEDAPPAELEPQADPVIRAREREARKARTGEPPP